MTPNTDCCRVGAVPKFRGLRFQGFADFWVRSFKALWTCMVLQGPSGVTPQSLGFGFSSTCFGLLVCDLGLPQSHLGLGCPSSLNPYTKSLNPTTMNYVIGVLASGLIAQSAFGVGAGHRSIKLTLPSCPVLTLNPYRKMQGSIILVLVAEYATFNLTVNHIKLETGLRPNSAGIPYLLLLRIEAMGLPAFCGPNGRIQGAL